MRIDTDLLCDLLVESAQAELIPRFQCSDSHLKADGSLVTQADLAMQQHILDRLNHHYPEIPLLGEEMPADRQLAILNDNTRGFWCLDPLDGTANFVAGMPFFAVSLAYMSNGRVELGLVYDPLRDELFHARRGSGAWLNQTPLNLDNRLDRLQECVAMVDFKRLDPALAHQLASAPPYRSQRSIGSVALDWCWLAAGRLQLYLHGGARLWDYAAGTLIFSEAGGQFSLIDPATASAAQSGPGLLPRMAVAAANQRLFENWLSWLKGFS
ncbi:MAG: inositol monophosphatase family protein [Candidatus Thiodiazotropha sp. (ex Ctena orbiculata)]|nr:inositol monophosphatase family protein [Candidatus Thiodiazotropha taylori]MBT2998914.1 inositol monophosphatase family protein [Candidatus Thiodiazotropha taylori]MBT3002856.1 inositol monophosphatase family protein [Candidatus Thiodiazotropha taylori]MBV2109143.1 inositol monophosphatase family protein [Candidatus Thiodiazotropha taylori]MBV2113291.1 inositol monophosphatase family protein [Candidatus Thiodiazotropha taylori]